MNLKLFGSDSNNLLWFSTFSKYEIGKEYMRLLDGILKQFIRVKLYPW